MFNLLEEIGQVKTARKERESISLARALLTNEPLDAEGTERFVHLAEKNKVLLRAAHLLRVPAETVAKAKDGVAEAFSLHNKMTAQFRKLGVSFVVLKSFDSLPDVGHDIDLLVPSLSDMRKAQDFLITGLKARAVNLTHCDKLVGKFSCFLPDYSHDFELYPTVSQMGEIHLDPQRVLKDGRLAIADGNEVLLTSDPDRVLIRVVHAMFRHNFLKLSDILDLLNLERYCRPSEILDKIDEAGIGDAFLFYLDIIARFLKACEVHDRRFNELREATENRFGRSRLGFLQKDRLVLPYRVPIIALFLVFLLKAGREAARGRWKSCLTCAIAPPLKMLDYVVAILRGGVKGGIW